MIDLSLDFDYERNAKHGPKFFLKITDKSEYERPAGRPAVASILKGFYLQNYEFDFHAVFTDGCIYSIEFDYCLIKLIWGEGQAWRPARFA